MNTGKTHFKKGFKHTEATKEKIKKNNARYFLGKKRSKETIEKLSGKNNWNWKFANQ